MEDIFRSLFPFTTGNTPITQIAMPLIASGAQGESPAVMLECLTDASIHWLSAGLPIERIKIILHPEANSQNLFDTFARVKQDYSKSNIVDSHSPDFRFDLFVSYSHKNSDEVDFLVEKLKDFQPTLRIFMDRLELHPGAAWQQTIFDAIEDSQKALCVITPDYWASNICKEEFNIAMLRHRETPGGVLLPYVSL